MMNSARDLRSKISSQLDPTARIQGGLSPLNKAVVVLILLAILIAVLETEPEIANGHEFIFASLELMIGIVFAVEYAARIWTAPERNVGVSPWRSRLRFALSPGGLLDALVIILTFAPLIVVNAAVVRLVRVVRIVSLAKLGRTSRALGHLFEAVRSRKDELIATAGVAAVVVLFGATALFWAEGSTQPEKFGSIPRSIWWAVVTLTTIGYGDAYPVTPIGKVLAAMVAIAGIALIAMPTGILAGSFSDALARDRARAKTNDAARSTAEAE
jgi:voltage-gated potassium channel